VARGNAEAALRGAKQAEDRLTELLGRSGDAAATTSHSPRPNTLARMDCLADVNGTQSQCKGVKGDDDLMAYATFPDGKYEGSPEQRLAAAYNTHFDVTSRPVTSRVTIGKGEQAIEGSYTLPLSRRRVPGDGLDTARAVTSTLIFKGSVAPDSNSSPGLITRDGSFNDSPVTISVGFGRQHFASVKLRGDKDTIETRARKFAGELINKCQAALAAKPDAFGTALEARPQGCEGDELLAWAFKAAGKDAVDANVDAYNAAFWDAPKDAVPALGWGVAGEVGTQEYKYILPSMFAPGILLDGASQPNVLSTLKASSDDGSASLGQQEERRWSFAASVYGFAHLGLKSSIIKHLLVKPSLTLSRRWRINQEFTDQEFCAIKVATIGECKKFNVAAPTVGWSFEPSINARWMFDLAVFGDRWRRYAPKIGFSPTLTWGSRDNNYRLAVPIFFAADKDNVLNAGVQYSREGGNSDDRKNASIWSVVLSTGFSMDGSK
jgi:hypothetical protein